MKRKKLKNKIYALILVGVGLVPLIAFNDATCLILTGLAGLLLFFAKENLID
jgi:hypothetical protein